MRQIAGGGSVVEEPNQTMVRNPVLYKSFNTLWNHLIKWEEQIPPVLYFSQILSDTEQTKQLNFVKNLYLI
jgi:hypothetical protein